MTTLAGAMLRQRESVIPGRLRASNTHAQRGGGDGWPRGGPGGLGAFDASPRIRDLNAGVMLRRPGPHLRARTRHTVRVGPGNSHPQFRVKLVASSTRLNGGR
jgi:hypothetical protein